MAYAPTHTGEFTPLSKLVNSTVRHYAPHVKITVLPIASNPDYMAIRTVCEKCDNGEEQTYKFGNEGTFTDIINKFTEKHLHREAVDGSDVVA